MTRSNLSAAIRWSLLVFVLLLGSGPALAQTIHQASVETVAKAYWSLLGRAPDKDGLLFWTYEMDRGDKDAAVINYAFLISAEYQEQTKHPDSCKADYSVKRNFAEVRHRRPQELLTLRGEFYGRGLVGENLDPATGFLGNTLSVKTSSCLYVLWYDYAAGDLHEMLPFVAMLPSSSEIEVTYDPLTGLAQSIRVTQWKAR